MHSFVGPETWAEVAPAAKGSKQSPIDIDPGKATFDLALKQCPLKMTYDASKAQQMLNTGRSIQVVYNSEGSCKSFIHTS